MQQTDRQTDRWIWRKKWHIEVGAPRKNKEKHLEISLFCTCVPKIFMGMIHSSWDIEHDRFKFWVIFYPFTPLKTQKLRILKNNKTCWRYNHFTHVYQKQQSYEVRFLKYGVRGQNFLSFCAIFCPFTPLTTQKIKILKKWKKQLEIILHICTKNLDHMMYASWDMESNKHNFLPFFALLPH